MAFSALKDVCTHWSAARSTLAICPISYGSDCNNSDYHPDGTFFLRLSLGIWLQGDFIWFLSRKLRKKSSAIGEKADKILKSLKYILLVLIVVFVWILGIAQIDSTASPGPFLACTSP
jgi:hypothetical protein